MSPIEQWKADWRACKTLDETIDLYIRGMLGDYGPAVRRRAQLMGLFGLMGVGATVGAVMSLVFYRLGML